MNSKGANRVTVLALYKFVSLPKSQLSTLKIQIEEKLRSVSARGTIILAPEGINGTICYPEKNALLPSDYVTSNKSNQTTDSVIEFLNEQDYFSGIRTRISYAETSIFHRLKVKIKTVIVTMTYEECNEQESVDGDKHKNKQHVVKVDPTDKVGIYVKAGKEWDDLLMDPDVVVIDTRNKYEVEVGTFENAISPNTDNFKQFPDWLHRLAAACKDADNKNETTPDSTQCVINNNLSQTSNARSLEPVPESDMPTVKRKPKAIAMFCTGGIRCEKSTSYALEQNVFPSDVPIYHLDGGILAYLDSYPDSKSSKWKGECFVFDQRVALRHGLMPSETYASCHACKRPLSEEDRKGVDYVEGISCKHCKDKISESQKERFLERQKQMNLSHKTGIVHIHDPKEYIHRDLS